MDIIRIKNALFYAYHGVASVEQTLGGKFEIDVDMLCDLSGAAASDNLQQTVNYEAVYAVIQRAATMRKHFLLESLAGTIADGILTDFSRVAELTVRVRKPHPPVKGVVDYVEIEVHRKRG